MGEDDGRYALNKPMSNEECLWQSFFTKNKLPFRYIKGSFFIGDIEAVFHDPHRPVIFVNGHKDVPANIDCFKIIKINELKRDEETIEKLKNV